MKVPDSVTIGVATAALQIEGDAASRGVSTWDTFAAEPGRILDGSTPATTADHVHRVDDDIALLTDLGVDSYRFSLSWPRIQPTGTGPPNPAGLAFYDRLIDRLLDAGIRPMVTLYHWDTPEPLQAAGGWMNRDTAQRLGDFAAIAGPAFGDRVDTWVTINEPATVTLNGYALGVHAPGQALLFDALPAAHHQLLGHGHAVQALRAANVTGGIGITNVHSPVVPARRRITDAFFARVFDLVHNRIFADPVLLGRYPTPPLGAGKLFRALTDASDDDLRVIHQPLDFYGLNYYMPTRIRAGASASTQTPDGEAQAMKDVPFSLLPFEEFPQTGFGWPIAPQYLEVALREVATRYGAALPPIHITENGASFTDAPATDGAVHDTERVAYLANHLEVALRGVPGVDVRGFFVWSLLDNWEWAAGFSQRFGLVHVDFDTLERTPKLSYRWLQGLLAARESSAATGFGGAA